MGRGIPLAGSSLQGMAKIDEERDEWVGVWERCGGEESGREDKVEEIKRMGREM